MRILRNFGGFYAILTQYKEFWPILSSFGAFYVILAHFTLFWRFLCNFDTLKGIFTYYKQFWRFLRHFGAFSSFLALHYAILMHYTQFWFNTCHLTHLPCALSLKCRNISSIFTHLMPIWAHARQIQSLLGNICWLSCNFMILQPCICPSFFPFLAVLWF